MSEKSQKSKSSNDEAGPRKGRPIRRLAIINRGEAAMRCVRAVKSLRELEGSDLSVIALYTDSDRDAPFVRNADASVRISSDAGDVAAFLDHDTLLEALHTAEADAVWPGWGFIAEDPTFVDRLDQAGILFLGPTSDAMRQLGDKISAKDLASRSNVPVTPWSGGAVLNADDAEHVAEKLGYPVAIKAAAGGGGRGIRMVDESSQVAEAFASAANEAQAAFGDSRLFIERKISGGRHIEVQIAADLYGNVIALGCRDCSVQRRHQKVVEEAPPPGLSRALQNELCQAAVHVSKQVGYTNVGTIEFLVRDEEFHFLEMNPRLQVEHGITEAVTGVDLVQLQIRIARGESLAALEFEERGAAIETRICAEDPYAGFIPSPGRVARFEPALGPCIRTDSGVTTGSSIPSSFDSLVAKVITTGNDREEARSRMACALADFDLTIEGGATNKGFLLEVIDSVDYRAGGVDTLWLDRFLEKNTHRSAFAIEAFLAASILAYQTNRLAKRVNFYTDTANISPTRIPQSLGQEIDLTYGAEQYHLEVYAVGSWRYRVHLDKRVIAVTLREESAGAARLEVGGRGFRILHDVTETGLRVEVDGYAHRFGLQTIGQVRATTPAVVVTVHVESGDQVTAGQTLGVVEAMKMEIGFEAPVSGVVTEVRALKGQQVAAGDVLMVIEPDSSDTSSTFAEARLTLPALPDPLQLLFSSDGNGDLGIPDLTSADRADHEERTSALGAARNEIRRVLLGYDANPDRAELLKSFLDAGIDENLSEAFRLELAEVRRELTLFADIEQLFIRSPRASVSGDLGPSNSARLRMYIRRMRADGAGIADEFLELARTALAHFGVTSLDNNDALERAVMRLLASQRSSALRGHLVLAVLGLVTRLAKAGVELGDDRELEDALTRIAGMRGLVSNALADASIDATYMIFERSRIEAMAERTNKKLQQWMAKAEALPTEPPEDILPLFADAPRSLIKRLGGWLSDDLPGRNAIAVSAHLRRLYSTEAPLRHESILGSGRRFDRIELTDGRIVLGGTLSLLELTKNTQWLDEALSGEGALSTESEMNSIAGVLELFIPVDDSFDANATLENLASAMAKTSANLRLTLNFISPDGTSEHRTLVPASNGLVEVQHFHGIHPETARRIDLERLNNFQLERIPAAHGIYCFHGRSKEIPADERIFVLADVGGRSPDDGLDVKLFLPTFEHAFHEATRALRSILRVRDPKRRLQWNRIVLFVAPEIFLDAEIPAALANRLAPATRNLGIEKIVVRMKLLDRDHPTRPAKDSEIIISDVTGFNMEMHSRPPHTDLLVACSDYERKVVAARRRRLVYPYEIIRMLTGSSRGINPNSQESRELGEVTLPAGTFEEYDLDTKANAPVARSVDGRPYGENSSSVVFGIVSTPRSSVPEGLRRVLILSDPTKGMGSLAAPECDRIIAALDLAEKYALPVEWLPVSGGAKISMDSGTENLDATARVVRRIVHFTQEGGVIHIIVHGVNVGAQSYWDALATMLMHTRGALIMTPGASMVLTGRAALEASGAVSAEDEESIGGFERIMGPNGQAQYFANDLTDAYRILYEHYRYTYVCKGEKSPRPFPTRDSISRSVMDYPIKDDDSGLKTVGEIFSDNTNPGRKRPFPMRSIMRAVIDQDGGHLERWRAMAGADTSIIWDAHIGGHPISLIGIESNNIPREGYRSLDGPENWTGGTLFPLSSKKTARAINAASGVRPVVVLANLSGFDGSPESMRKLQLEYGAEIARAVVNFEGPILFLVVSRYHGGAYVVFSQELNPGLRASALTGSYASVIGGGPAAAVVFAREVRARTANDPRVIECEQALRANNEPDARSNYESVVNEVSLQLQAELATEFDNIHSVDRARRVGSLTDIIEPADMRPYLAAELDHALRD